MSAFTCKHGITAPTAAMDSLPEGQAGPARHKCASCAFRAGAEWQAHRMVGVLQDIDSDLERAGLQAIADRLLAASFLPDAGDFQHMEPAEQVARRIGSGECN